MLPKPQTDENASFFLPTQNTLCSHLLSFHKWEDCVHDLGKCCWRWKKRCAYTQIRPGSVSTGRRCCGTYSLPYYFTFLNHFRNNFNSFLSTDCGCIFLLFMCEKYLKDTHISAFLPILTSWPAFTSEAAKHNQLDWVNRTENNMKKHDFCTINSPKLTKK